jgi:hypothetical protein
VNVAVDAATYLLHAFVRGSGGDVHPKLVMEFHMFLFKRHLGLVKLIETGAPPLVGVPNLLGPLVSGDVWRGRLTSSGAFPIMG